MPPIPKIKKEDIVSCAFAIVQQEGLSALNARRLASELKCSTQPIFRIYDTMEALKEDITKKANDYYNSCMMEGLAHPIPFLGMGLAYTQFAQNEKQLFRLLFMSNTISIHSFKDMITGDDNQSILSMISQATHCTLEQAENLLVQIWLLMHGMATLIATNDTEISNTEIEQILKKAFHGFLHIERNPLENE